MIGELKPNEETYLSLSLDSSLVRWLSEVVGILLRLKAYWDAHFSGLSIILAQLKPASLTLSFAMRSSSG